MIARLVVAVAAALAAGGLAVGYARTRYMPLVGWAMIAGIAAVTLAVDALAGPAVEAIAKRLDLMSRLPGTPS